MPRKIISVIGRDGISVEPQSTEEDQARLKDMFAARRAPGANTDQQIGREGDVEHQFKGREKVLQNYLKVAEKHGFTPGRNDFYEPSIARFPGDPQAWVPNGGGYGYMKKRCEEEGWQAEGAFSTTYVESIQEEKPLADDLVKSTVKDYRKNPKYKTKSEGELKEMVVEKHGCKEISGNVENVGDFSKIKKLRTKAVNG